MTIAGIKFLKNNLASSTRSIVEEGKYFNIRIKYFMVLNQSFFF